MKSWKFRLRTSDFRLRTSDFALLILACLILAFTQEAGAQTLPADSTRRLRLIFAGDIMGHSTQISAAQVEKDKLYDYTPCFEYVAPLLAGADLAIGNLELTLPGKPPYTGYPMFRSPVELALALRHAGFNMLVTANNHSNDSGAAGLINTLNVLDNYGFYHTGTFRDSAEWHAFYPLIIYRNNFKLAFLNYTYDTNGLPTRAPTIVNQIDEKRIKGDMEVARALQPDFIIVVMHWGLEYQRQESEAQRRLARKLIGWGADLIVGAHPHVVQPIRWETAPGPDGQERRVLVAYSLGNFISGQVKEHTDGGIMLQVDLVRDSLSAKTSVTGYDFIPVWRQVQRYADGRRTYRVLPVSPLEKNTNAVPGLTELQHASMMRYARSTRALLEAAGSKERLLSLTDIIPEKTAPPAAAGNK